MIALLDPRLRGALLHFDGPRGTLLALRVLPRAKPERRWRWYIYKHYQITAEGRAATAIDALADAREAARRGT